mmetsp:Transcript_16675/g.31190  ORF Transcript_16675/g.31190 Transcript_16675/m.31190 type:complete len:494 (+) Transcript_16675:78-1559(+)
MATSNPLANGNLEIALDETSDQVSLGGDDILVMNEASRNKKDPHDHCCLNPMCDCCCPKQCGPFCPPVCLIMAFICFNFYLCLGLNLLAEASTVSPFEGVTVGMGGGDAGLLLTGAGLGSFLLWCRFCVCTDGPTEGEKRRQQQQDNAQENTADETGGVSSDQVSLTSEAEREPEHDDCCDLCELFLKKVLTCTFLYLILGILCCTISRAAMYPGMFVKLGSETPPNPLTGEEFVFPGKDEVELNGYHVKYSKSCMDGCMELPDTVTKVYPVVMLGGNGGSGWFNVEQARDFIRRKVVDDDDETIGYDVFSFSYRGYEPNEDFPFYLVDEFTVAEDAEKLFRYVRTRDEFFGTRPLLLAHSIGTGPGSYLAMMLDEDEVSCVGLGMPFASGTQVAMELSMYAAPLFFWTIDRWDSERRIKAMDYRIPFLVLSAGHDELIAPHQQEAVFEASGSTDKYFLYYEEGTHMSVGGTINSDGDTYDKWFEHCLRRVGV